MYVYQTIRRHVSEDVNIYCNETVSFHNGLCLLWGHILCTRVTDTSGTSRSPADTRYPVPLSFMKYRTWTRKDTHGIYRIWFICLFRFLLLWSSQPVCAALLPLMFLTSSQRIKRDLLFCHIHTVIRFPLHVIFLLFYICIWEIAGKLRAINFGIFLHPLQFYS